ncbi:MAG TPA: tetratricopeptide repeat protein, partial [Gemmataceae bacterium]|nr:tetratricopeptide repeat protein [Gemmataceae bacterium]
PDARPSIHKRAMDHLEEALALGVASADLAPLKYRIGFTLYKQGKDPKRAIDLMTQSVEKGADRPAQGYGVLVQAYLALPKPNLEAALGASQRQLELAGDRNLEEMAQARLTRGELLLRKHQRPDALKELELIGKEAPRALRLKARFLQARICEEEGLWNKSIPVWRELLNDADGVPGGKVAVLYALGLAYMNGDPKRTDEARASWENAYALGGDEGRAAGFRLGEMELHGPKADVVKAIAIWTKVLENVRSPNGYHIQSLKLSRAREILDSACRYLLDNQDYEQTRQVADLYKRIAAAGVAEEHEAQAAEGLARALREKIKDLGLADDARQKEELRAQFHRAAVAHEQAAVARADDGQREIYWRSALCYLAAQDFTRAGDILDKFVTLEKNEGRKAEAYLAMAEAYVALGETDKARQAYYKCIEFPFTPFAFRARYQLAVEEINKTNYEQALDILNQNLKFTGPVPDRSAHEKSIFKIADLYSFLKDYDKAALYYKEASRQYPNNAGALAARDQLAKCYYELAKQALDKAKVAGDPATKVHHENSRQSWLEQGFIAYESLADELEHKSRQTSLPPAELVLLRDALFGAADLKLEMNEFSEALRRYKDLQEKYRQQLAGLMACHKIWRCSGYMWDTTPQQRTLARTAAVEALKKAKADLETMPESSEAFHGGPSVWPKAEWQRLLLWIEDKLNPPAVRPSPGPFMN